MKLKKNEQDKIFIERLLLTKIKNLFHNHKELFQNEEEIRTISLIKKTLKDQEEISYGTFGD